MQNFKKGEDMARSGLRCKGQYILILNLSKEQLEIITRDLRKGDVTKAYSVRKMTMKFPQAHIFPMPVELFKMKSYSDIKYNFVFSQSKIFYFSLYSEPEYKTYSRVVLRCVQ